MDAQQCILKYVCCILLSVYRRFEAEGFLDLLVSMLLEAEIP